MTDQWIRVVFIIAGIYDGMLGMVFLFMPEAIFAFYAVTPPIFAIMFFRIAMDPVRFRELMLYGVGLKVAYCSLVFKYVMIDDVPTMWVPWAWLDLVFLVAFLMAWYRTWKISRPA
jgi:hypothetical protein